MTFVATQVQRLFGNHFFEIPGFTTQVRHFTCVGLPDNIAGQTLFASLHEVLGPLVIQTLRNAFSSAQLGNAVLATQSIQNNANFLLRTVLLTRLALDVTSDLFGRRCSGKPKISGPVKLLGFSIVD